MLYAEANVDWQEHMIHERNQVRRPMIVAALPVSGHSVPFKQEIEEINDEEQYLKRVRTPNVIAKWLLINVCCTYQCIVNEIQQVVALHCSFWSIFLGEKVLIIIVQPTPQMSRSDEMLDVHHFFLSRVSTQFPNLWQFNS